MVAETRNRRSVREHRRKTLFSKTDSGAAFPMWCHAMRVSDLHGPMWNNLPVSLAAHHDWFLVACAAGTVLLLLILIAKVRLHPALALAVSALRAGRGLGDAAQAGSALLHRPAWAICWATSPSCWGWARFWAGCWPPPAGQPRWAGLWWMAAAAGPAVGAAGAGHSGGDAGVL